MRTRGLALIAVAIGFVMTLVGNALGAVGILVLWVGFAFGIPGRAILRWGGGFVVAVLVGAVGLMLGGARTTSAPTKLTLEQQQSIESALSAQRLPAAQSIEITGGRLVATFEIDDAALALMVAAGISSPREFASKAVITVRNAELPFNLVDSYRVTMNGPPPGPGLITRYGSARFSEGSSVTWEPGPPR